MLRSAIHASMRDSIAVIAFLSLTDLAILAAIVSADQLGHQLARMSACRTHADRKQRLRHFSFRSFSNIAIREAAHEAAACLKRPASTTCSTRASASSSTCHLLRYYRISASSNKSRLTKARCGEHAVSESCELFAQQTALIYMLSTGGDVHCFTHSSLVMTVSFNACLNADTANAN